MSSFVSKDLHLCNLLDDNGFDSYNTRAERLFSTTRNHNVNKNIAEHSTSSPFHLSTLAWVCVFTKAVHLFWLDNELHFS